jgi:hypothetical protein
VLQVVGGAHSSNWQTVAESHRKKARWRPDRDNIAATGSSAIKAVAAPRPSANASELFSLRNKR